MSNKQAYQQKVQAQLDEWSAEIDKLRAKADKADADAQIALNREIDDLRDKKNQAREKLDELSDASEGAWEDLKTGIESASNQLGQALRSAQSRFN
ncbi:MAG: coiled coil domain-containing protein [Rhodospirillales bacterium]|nr:coiled coil domain-containing protein [Rhodospirillales bacterium]